MRDLGQVLVHLHDASHLLPSSAKPAMVSVSLAAGLLGPIVGAAFAAGTTTSPSMIADLH